MPKHQYCNRVVIGQTNSDDVPSLTDWRDYATNSYVTQVNRQKVSLTNAINAAVIAAVSKAGEF